MKHALLSTLLLTGLAGSALAQARPQQLQATTPENIPTTSMAAAMQYLSASTVTTLTVPYFADSYIMNGDNAWVCDNSKRCNVNTFPASTVSVTGWVFNPAGRRMISNLQASQTVIGFYARPQDIVSGTNIVGVEWFCQGTCQ